MPQHYAARNRIPGGGGGLPAQQGQFSDPQASLGGPARPQITSPQGRMQMGAYGTPRAQQFGQGQFGQGQFGFPGFLGGGLQQQLGGPFNQQQLGGPFDQQQLGGPFNQQQFGNPFNQQQFGNPFQYNPYQQYNNQ